MSRARLVEAILEPSKEIDPGYLPVVIVTSDGLSATGIFFKRYAGVQEIYDSQGLLRTFRVENIELMQSSDVSIMPAGLHQNMSLQEFRDLLAYLQQPTK